MPQISNRLYRKPEAICAVFPEWERITSPEEVKQFIASGKKEIEERVSRLNLILRLATLDDIEGIQQLHIRAFPNGTSTLEDAYVLFRIISFGYAPVLEARDGRIVGCNICQGHDDPERTAYGVRITVDPSMCNHNLGAELVNYTCLLGMERGSHLRRGLLSPTNYGSACNFLNHVGYLGESFNPDVPGFGPRFTVALPLTPGGVRNNRIDLDKVKDFVNTHEPEKDYLIVDCTDLDKITWMYDGSPFRVVAFLKGGENSKENSFFALPKDVLGFPKTDDP